MKAENECGECQAHLPADAGALCNACALRYEFERADEWWA